jgi:hypothetical protein
MNLRTLKTQCKRAREVLIEHHGVKARYFLKATGDESIDAPRGMELRFDRGGWLDPGPLPGTPLYWAGPGYDDDGDDPQLPTDLLAEITMWQHWKPSAAEIAEWDAHADRENANLAAIGGAA